MRWTPVLFSIGCAGSPRFEHTMPPVLPTAGPPVPAERVAIDLEPYEWSSNAGTSEHFMLGFPGTVAHAGVRLGPIRSADVPLDETTFATVRCAWKIVPIGDARPCEGARSEGQASAQPTLERAFDDLRTRAGAAGASIAGGVRCFAETTRLWCEGAAIVASTAPADASATPVVGTDGNDVEIPITRLAVAGDGSVGMLGAVPVVGAALALRYRPIEVAFDVLDLTRDGTNRNLVGVGGTVLARARAGSVEGMVGGSVIAIAPNGSVNPHVSAMYAGFVGVGYQSRWRWMGAAQPFIQLRAGPAVGGPLASTIVPFVSVHLGFSSPDR